MNKNSRFLVIGAVSAIAVVAYAQTTTNQSSQSNSQSGNGSASASSSASSSARAGGSQNGFGQGGGQQGGGFGGGSSASGSSMPMPNYALILNKSTNTPISRELWQQEIAYWQNLANRGAATLAGNWREWDGGLVLLNVKDDTIARTVAETDPGVKAGVFRYEIHGFEVKAMASSANPANLVPGGFIRAGGSNSSGGSSSQNGGSSSQNGGSSSQNGGSSSSSGGTTRKGG